VIQLWATLAIAAAASAAALSPLSSPLNDYNPSYDRAERMLVFARSEADFQKARILFSEKRGRGWSAPAPISFSDERYSDSDPWLTEDGRTLYFVSNRPTAARPDKKDLDIWRATRVRRGWSAPEHLGDIVNSPGPELGVELHRGVLYFASYRKGGKGGLDIYASRLVKGGFAPPELLEGPFNSAESDSDFTLSADGRLAAFWRGSGGTGLIQVAQRQGAGWSAPVPLPASINIGAFNFTPSFSRDGKSLRFASTVRREGQAAGMADIYVAKLPALPR
jgi:hypothetical protein